MCAYSPKDKGLQRRLFSGRIPCQMDVTDDNDTNITKTHCILHTISTLNCKESMKIILHFSKISQYNKVR